MDAHATSEFLDMLSVAKTGHRSEVRHGARTWADEWAQQGLNKFFTGDYTTSPLVELYYRLKAEPLSGHGPTDAYVRLRKAFDRDITKTLDAQVKYRREHGGNIVIEWTGPTGMGKSSCMLGFMEYHNGLKDIVQNGGADALRKHVALDIPALPSKLDGLQAGQAVAMDEQLHLVGEGSRNAMDTLANLEETLRGTGIDIHFASPSLREHSTSQGILEAFSWNPTKKVTCFLVKLALAGDPEPMPLGYAVLPWCSPETWEAYQPIKRESLERTKRMQFNAASAVLDDQIQAFCSIPSVQARFKVKTPSKNDIARWWRRSMPSTGINEADTMAEEICEMMRTARHAPTLFRTIYGWEPSPEMLACFKPTRTTNMTDAGGLKTF